MAVTFRILPHKGLVYVRYSGKMVVSETEASIASYMAHPDYAPGQNQLIDMAAVTDWERDYPRLLALQVKMVHAFLDPAHHVMVVGFAPNPLARQVANFHSRAWDDVCGVTSLVATTETDALGLLGIRETDFAELLATA